MDLAVNGAFLEIGLTPNSGPVAGLLTLTPGGEIRAGRDQSTAVPALFAAGDVTDEQDKQIVTAAAAGAKATLAAHRYLLAHEPKIPADSAAARSPRSLTIRPSRSAWRHSGSTTTRGCGSAPA